MRIIVIPDLEYDSYSSILDTIVKNIPFSLVNQIYRPNLKIGCFYFWDESYIPDPLRKYIKRPPVNHENIAKMHEEISQVL